MRKVILNLAMSLDGYIANPDGSFEWITGHEDKSLDTDYQFSFESFVDSIDTIVMGSKAYEDCILTNMSDFKDKEIIVFTSRQLEKKKHVEFVKGDICEKIRDLQDCEGNDIYLFGGAGNIEPLLASNLIDTYIIGIIPIILGKGIRLFNESELAIKLKLVQSSVSDGISILEYERR